MQRLTVPQAEIFHANSHVTKVLTYKILLVPFASILFLFVCLQIEFFFLIFTLTGTSHSLSALHTEPWLCPASLGAPPPTAILGSWSPAGRWGFPGTASPSRKSQEVLQSVQVLWRSGQRSLIFISSQAGSELCSLSIQCSGPLPGHHFPVTLTLGSNWRSHLAVWGHRAQCYEFATA